MHTDVAEILLAVLLIASFGVWAWLGWRWRAGIPPLPHRSRRDLHWNPAAVVVTLLLWLALQIFAGSLVGNGKEFSLRDVQASVLSNTLLLIFGPLTLISMMPGPLRDFGIDASNWRRQVQIGGFSFLASVLPVAVVVWATHHLRSPDTLNPFLQYLEQNRNWHTVAWMVLAVVVLAPLAEEFLFRVVLQGWLQTYLPAASAILIPAVVFCVVHGWPDSIALFPLAVILGYVYWRSFSFLAICVVHALFNTANLALAVLSGVQ